MCRAQGGAEGVACDGCINQHARGIRWRDSQQHSKRTKLCKSCNLDLSIGAACATMVSTCPGQCKKLRQVSAVGMAMHLFGSHMLCACVCCQTQVKLHVHWFTDCSAQSVHQRTATCKVRKVKDQVANTCANMQCLDRLAMQRRIFIQ